MKESVLFKNSPDRLLLVLNNEDDFDVLLEAIHDKVSKNLTFFKGYKLNLKYDKRKLTKQEEEMIVKVFTDLGVQVDDISEETIKLKKNASQSNSLVTLSRRRTVTRRSNRTSVNEFDEGMVSFYKGTIRSGQTINSNGNIVILGDVNPGAEIKAKGNIIVFGTIRGSVSAGTDGNDNAFIIGRGIYPSSLTIADLVTIPPEEENMQIKKMFGGIKKGKNKVSKKELEIAYIKDGNIYIDLYDSVY